MTTQQQRQVEPGYALWDATVTIFNQAQFVRDVVDEWTTDASRKYFRPGQLQAGVALSEVGILSESLQWLNEITPPAWGMALDDYYNVAELLTEVTFEEIAVSPWNIDNGYAPHHRNLHNRRRIVIYITMIMAIAPAFLCHGDLYIELHIPRSSNAILLPIWSEDRWYMDCNLQRDKSGTIIDRTTSRFEWHQAGWDSTAECTALARDRDSSELYPRLALAKHIFIVARISIRWTRKIGIVPGCVDVVWSFCNHVIRSRPLSLLKLLYWKLPLIR